MSNRPVTKREQYLAKAAGITSGSTPPAVTRTEHFLKAIADGTGYQSLPTAVTKEEQYLKAMTGAPIGNAFFVWHSSVKGGGTNGMPERVTITDEILENGYDLTSHIPYGTLYGGYALIDGITMTEDPYDGANWTWTTMETASGQTLQPVAGETYVVKELPWGYLKIHAYQGRQGGVWKNLYYLSCWDGCDDADPGLNPNIYINGHISYADAGWYLWKEGEADKIKFANAACGKIGTYNAMDSYFKPNYGMPDGIPFIGLGEGSSQVIVANTAYTIRPYVTTPDGVEVVSPACAVIQTGDLTQGALKMFRTDINAPYTPPEPEPEEEEEET